MIIALDYDGTYTADPKMWDKIVLQFLKAGHQVIVVTMRHESEPIPQMPTNLKIYYTSREAKGRFMTRIGVQPNIWIDDNPYWILQNG